ncbi:MAG TPA: hypothetical protein VFA65_03260 [Bryobacteraceae bacterium]|nr:hypothetical protein [Bryobacteraceae bacterium]
MKLTAFVSACLAMFGSFAKAQVQFTSSADAQNDGQAIVTNTSSSALIAIGFWISNEPCAPMDIQPDVFRIVDVATSLNGKPIAPGQTEKFSIGSKGCNKVGTTTPAKARFGAAIFQDGVTYGDKQAAERILDNRRAKLQQVENSIRSGGQGNSLDALKRLRDQILAAKPPLK